MKDEYALVPEYATLVPVVGNAYKGVSEAIGSSRVSTYGTLADVVSWGAKPTAELGAKLAVDYVAGRIEKGFEADQSWWERNIYLDPAKRALHEASKEWWSALAGAATSVAVQGGAYLIGSALAARDAEVINAFIFDSMHLVALEGGALRRPQVVAMDLVLSQLGIVGEARGRLLARPRPTFLGIDPIQTRKEARLALFYPAAEVALVSEFSGRYEVLFDLGANKLGLTVSQMRRVVNELVRDNRSRSTHLNALLGIYSKVMIDLHVDLDLIQERAAVLARFDPLEESRRGNRNLVKRVVNTGLGVAAQTLPDPSHRLIATAAHQLCVKILVEEDGLPQRKVVKAVQRLAPG